MSRYIYELARDHRPDVDTTAEESWHIVRLDDEKDPDRLHTLCDRELEAPVEHWNVESLKNLETMTCEQCQTRLVAESGREAV